MTDPEPSDPNRGRPSQSKATPDSTGTPDSDPGGDLDGRLGSGGPPSPLWTATGRIRRDPLLALPFVVAGILLALIDWVRRRDPLPTLVPDGGEGLTITVEFAGYPTGVPETVRSLEALVDLKLPYLAWGIGLEGGALLVVAVAGVVTIARALEDDDEVGSTAGARGRVARRVPAYFALVVLFDAGGRLLGTLGNLGLVVGIPVLVAVLVVMVRLFAAPAFAATGSGPIAALRRSHRVTRGSGWSIAGLVLAFGLASWLLTSLPVPYAGVLLSTVLVAPVHAVAVAVIRERADGTPARSD